MKLSLWGSGHKRLTLYSCTASPIGLLSSLQLLSISFWKLVSIRWWDQKEYEWSTHDTEGAAVLPNVSGPKLYHSQLKSYHSRNRFHIDMERITNTLLSLVPAFILNICPVRSRSDTSRLQPAPSLHITTNTITSIRASLKHMELNIMTRCAN